MVDRDRLERERNILQNSFGHGPFPDGLARQRIEAIDALLSQKQETAMATEFVVIDTDGCASYHADEKNSDNDGPESFEGLDSALARAKELAAMSPGQPIKIFKIISVVLVPIAPIEVRDVQD